ncbi:hypothetical protein J1N35_041303 [Gossypium stocksii]|uniref:Aminotransferase-like plant mobile domain-containing protein n=1 Tax=Gossypium stocksii TaxID=47602 RepID=A0A9D3UFL6_9ROSI|nr:hypothetical protein J1N35_041303 [Gossypium stocksii]
MDTFLIHFVDNHIFAVQLVMVDNRVLEAFIHNTGEPPILEIHGYLQEAGFLHAFRMQRGCKLDPTLISAFLERWRPEAHTFYLSCGECKITLKDVALQLSLSVDEPVITGSTVVWRKMDLCMGLLGRVPNSEWAKLSWGFSVLSTLYWELCLAMQPNKMSNGGCLFELMSYADPDIISCIPLKVLANREMWHVKVPFIVYAMVKIHESNQVLRQFGYRQRIPPPPRDMNELHKIDMRGKNNEDWVTKHREWLLYKKDDNEFKLVMQPTGGLFGIS